MIFKYRPQGVCSTEIIIEVKENVVEKVSFTGGCQGNLTAISRLVEGMTMAEVIEKLKHITCRPNGASCPDQLARALEEFGKK